MLELVRKKAFTLAEILVVMGLIGVVAALTVPNLKDNSDVQVNVAKIKKVYSELATAFDRYALKARVAQSGWTADVATSGMNSSMKIKGRDASYWFDNTATGCASATGLDDGSTYCVRAVANNTSCLNVLIDIDGPKKGYNEAGYDVFYASIRIPATADSPEMVPWDCSDTGTFESTKVPSSSNYLNWVMLYDNLDYRKCPGNLKYKGQTSCN